MNALELYFLALVDKSQIPADAAERTQWMKSIPGILELTHNHGTENDADFAYHNGNTDPRLVVLADPCGRAWLAASAEDWLIPSGILGATVSGPAWLRGV